MTPRPALALLGLFALATPLAAQDPTRIPDLPAASDLGATLPFDPNVVRGTLPNGLRYYIMENRYPEQRAELRLAVRVGSVVEDADQRGLAHVAEHMAFNGTTSFPKNELVHYLQSIGSRFGPDVNAYTSFDETVYMLQVPTDSGKFLDQGMRILSEWAHGVTFDPAEIDAERGVVIEEWRLRRGAGARMQDKHYPMITRGSQYADRMIIGTLESLQGFEHDALTRFYGKWYRPDLMAVVAVGDFDKDEVEAMIREKFGVLRAGTPTERPEYPIPPHDEVYVSVATDPEATNSSFQVYNLLPRRDHSVLRGFRDRWVERIGLSMFNARLQELGQKPNPPFAFAAASRGYFNRSADSHTLFGGVREGGTMAGFEAVLTEAERAIRFGFTATELGRVMTQQRLSQENLFNEINKRPSAARAAELLRNFLQDEDVLGTAGEYHMYKALEPGITLAEVNAVTQALLTGQNRVIVVSAPEKAGVPVPTAAELLAVHSKVKAMALEPYQDSVVSTPLLAQIPEPVAITATSTIPELNVTEWTLANGVKVVLKPSDFMNDQVVMTASSPGGHSLVPDSLFVSAMYATTVANVGGIGELSAVDLRKVLTGKQANVTVSISERGEGVFGLSNARDVETMLQLAYLRFTAPRRDSTAWESLRQSQQASMANSQASPQKTFSDTITMTMASNHPRAVVMTPELLDRIDIDRALAVYRDRFADASDFTFFIVGNFQLDTIRPLVQRYLGSLPSIGREEKGRDVGIRPPTGRVEKVVRKGSEPQSQSYMAFTGEWEWSTEEAHLVASLGEVLSNRLIDKLREEMGGTYGANAFVRGTRDEPQRYTATISFGSAPDRAAELEAAVLEEIADLAENGPTALEMEKVRESQLRAREVALKTNFFWTGALSSSYQYEEDPREILAYPELVAALTADRIREAAGRYLKSENYVHVVLQPSEVVP